MLLEFLQRLLVSRFMCGLQNAQGIPQEEVLFYNMAPLGFRLATERSLKLVPGKFELI